jgi:hypothetical protein
MISAADALRLGSAQLTEEDNKIVQKLLGEIDNAIRNKKVMRRNGFDYTTNSTNPAAMFEVVSILQDHGYVVNCQPILRQGQVHGSKPFHDGYALNVAPSREAVIAARGILQ